MANQYIIRCIGTPQQYHLQWMLLNDRNQLLLQGNNHSINELPLPTKRDKVIVLLPSNDINLYNINNSDFDSTKLRQELPQLLADNIADDIDNCYFIPVQHENKKELLVAIIRKNLLDDWIQLFNRQKFSIKMMTSETFALPYATEKWFALIDRNLVWLRIDFFSSFCIERELFATFLNSLIAENQHSLPTTLVIKNLSRQSIQDLSLSGTNIIPFYELSTHNWLETLTQTLPQKWPINFLDKKLSTDKNTLLQKKSILRKFIPWR